MTQASAGAQNGTAYKDLSPVLIREQARAKVNLTLHVKGKRNDGYHELESLVAFADICDELVFTPASSDSLSLEGPFASAVDGENLVFKAKRAVAEWLDREIRGDFRLQKNIPVAAGLGGGSSDAAAAIRALFKAYGVASDPSAFATRAAAIGADIPVCLYQRAAWMRGLGEHVTPVPRLTALPAVLVNPRLKLSTAAVFKTLNAAAYDSAKHRESGPISTDWKDPEHAAMSLREGRNDLERPAIALEPAVASVLSALENLGDCLLARLSGSGPTCFGLFPSKESADDAAREIGGAHPHWWVAATTLS
jgi:4-diphosphocytidyl-2-C-methyl-D-erythritol kinase